MPEPALVFWIIGAPFILAIVDLIRTRNELRTSGSSARGTWSESLGVSRPAGMAPAIRK